LPLTLAALVAAEILKLSDDEAGGRQSALQLISSSNYCIANPSHKPKQLPASDATCAAMASRKALVNELSFK